ncbi:hypothetical protein GCM10023331_11790 [Algivirga pacifica]|uniref:PpiC domain-containing protein n=2 Tax=Algivirga pacifica TaxID=1162670 RepID=A0ABP9D9G7_9BACT
MNLDHDDEVIKRRLSQKMRFLSNTFSTLADPPTDERLKAYLRENEEQYQRPPTYSFLQVPFTYDHHSNPEEVANKLLQQHKTSKQEDHLVHTGDPLFIPKEFVAADTIQINKTMGGAIVTSLSDAPLGQWFGPIQSGLGYHLIYIKEKTPATLPDFHDIRNQLERDYVYDTEKMGRKMIYEKFKENYDIIITSDQYQELLGDISLQHTAQ